MSWGLRNASPAQRLESSPLDKMLRSVHTVSKNWNHHSTALKQADLPKIRPQVHNLPGAQTNQHAHCPKCKPLDPFIRALICISKLLLPDPQILHLLHDFIHCLLNPPQVCLDRLQLLHGLNGRPVLRVSADVDVQLNVSARILSYFYEQVHQCGSVQRRISGPDVVSQGNRMVEKEAYVVLTVYSRSRRRTPYPLDS